MAEAKITKQTSHITSYDLVKTFAVVIMIIDHIGAYFFPDHLWFRAIGRTGFPVWFFLVGHARGRDISPRLLGSAAVLLAANCVVGMPLFPLNALFTIILIRLLIDPVMRVSLASKWHLWGVTFVMVVWILLSQEFTEYGSLAMLTAMFGYMVRYRQDINDERLIVQFMIFVLLCFVGVQALSFGFSIVQFIVMAMGTAIVRVMLYAFRPVVYADWKMPLGVTWFFKICGRQTLEIYVVHLIIFKVIALYLGTQDDLGLLAFKLF